MVKIQTSCSVLQWKWMLLVTLCSLKQAGLPLQETSDNSQCFLEVLTSHPFRAAFQKPLLSQGKIAWVSSANSFCSLAARRRGGKRPPLFAYFLSMSTPSGQQESVLGFLQSSYTCKHNVSSQKPSCTCKCSAKLWIDASIHGDCPQPPTQTQLLLVETCTSISPISLSGFPQIYIY